MKRRPTRRADFGTTRPLVARMLHAHEVAHAHDEAERQLANGFRDRRKAYQSGRNARCWHCQDMAVLAPQSRALTCRARSPGAFRGAPGDGLRARNANHVLMMAASEWILVAQQDPSERNARKTETHASPAFTFFAPNANHMVMMKWKGSRRTGFFNRRPADLSVGNARCWQAQHRAHARVPDQPGAFRGAPGGHGLARNR